MSEVAKIERQEVTQVAPMASMIERVATDPNVSIEKLERMLDMQERVLAREAKAEHADAKARAMAEMPDIPMTGKGHNGRPYATLKDITRTTRPVLGKHGLSLTFDVKVDNGTISVTAILTHRNGHDERVSIPLPSDNSGSKNAVQAIGSSQTYGQRYTAQAILGLSLDESADDDGSAALGKQAITEGQYKELREKIDATGSDEAKLLAFFKVENLVDLPQAKFGPAIAMLERKAKK